MKWPIKRVEMGILIIEAQLFIALKTETCYNNFVGSSKKNMNYTGGITMKIMNLNMQNFKGFENCNLNIDGKSTVIFGINGTGKSSVLAAINYLCWNWLYRLNQAQGVAFKSLDSSLVHSGTSKLEISGEFAFGGEIYLLKKEYTKARPGKGAAVAAHKKLYDAFLNHFIETYGDDGGNIPIFVHYGTNRSVLDIPLRIRNKHQFSKWTALERAMENDLDYRTFFEWFRNQEDYEAEVIRERQDFTYQDRSLQCVRKAVQAMLPEFSNLKVKRNPLRLSVTKNDVEYSVDQLSDGEKCTLALMGDLARRLALANQNADNPLEGEGIVLIDEIELHMHPSWQRKVLPILCETFPSIQFIITTHSPQVLGEVDENFRLFMLSDDMKHKIAIQSVNRMDGFDSNYILEEHMGTKSVNPVFQTLVDDTVAAIETNRFEEAEQLLSKVREIVGLNNAAVIELEGFLKRGRLRYEKNH